jgi:AP2 domain
MSRDSKAGRISLAAGIFKEFLIDKQTWRYIPCEFKLVQIHLCYLIYKMRGTAERQSGHTGVSWSKAQKGWNAGWSVNGKQITKAFTVAQFGEGDALKRAIELRKAMVAKYMTPRSAKKSSQKAPISDRTTASVPEVASTIPTAPPTVEISPSTMQSPPETSASLDMAAGATVVNNTFNISDCTISFFTNRI